jgi:hypothetical protein
VTATADGRSGGFKPNAMLADGPYAGHLLSLPMREELSADQVFTARSVVVGTPLVTTQQQTPRPASVGCCGRCHNH